MYIFSINCGIWNFSAPLLVFVGLIFSVSRPKLLLVYYALTYWMCLFTARNAENVSLAALLKICVINGLSLLAYFFCERIFDLLYVCIIHYIIFFQCDELQTQRKLRNELIQLEDSLAKVLYERIV